MGYERMLTGSLMLLLILSWQEHTQSRMTLTQQQVCVQEVDMVTCRCGDKMKPVEKVMPAYLGIRMQGFLRQSEDKNKVFRYNHNISWVPSSNLRKKNVV